MLRRARLTSLTCFNHACGTPNDFASLGRNLLSCEQGWESFGSLLHWGSRCERNIIIRRHESTTATRLRWLVGRAVSPLNRPAPGASIPCLSWPVEISWPTVTLMAHRNLMAHLISCSNQNSFP